MWTQKTVFLIFDASEFCKLKHDFISSNYVNILL